MSLTDLWRDSREQLQGKKVIQVIAFAGSGRLMDDSPAAAEFREFLGHVPSVLLSAYADECLVEGFADSGLALQDIVNQIGRRLGLAVDDGRYRGKPGKSGEDGVWHLPDRRSIIVEVKTTDAYRIDIDRLAEFRKLLAAEERIDPTMASHLIVVGRQDTGDVEAQIRGSRHAWDFRLISIDALLRLMRVKESIDDPQTLARIHAILVPREFTRVDGIVDLLFSTAEEVTEEIVADAPVGSKEGRDVAAAGEPRLTPVQFHDACVMRLQDFLKTALVKRSRTRYESPDGRTRIVCAVSKRHDFAGDEAYWFAFHPYSSDFLESSERGFAAFGCGSEHTLFVFPSSDFKSWLDGAYVTEGEDRFYWHVQLFREGSRWWFKRRQGNGNVNVSDYLIKS